MGFQAPSEADKMTSVFTALLSYNRPFILVALFLGLLVVALVISKRNILVSLLASLGGTTILAVYYTLSYIGIIRY